MTLLGFDTSTAASTACLLRSDGQAFERTPGAERLLGRPGHAAELMPSIHDALQEAGVGFAELDAVAVGRGPGTFTGLRIGIATARALAKAHGLPVRGVSSLAALAAGMPPGLRLPLIDAKRGEVYAALFDGDSERWPPFAARPEELVERLREASVSPLAAGDGSLRFRDQLEAAGVEVAAAESPLHLVSALQICRLAAQAPDSPPEALIPDYLRDPGRRAEMNETLEIRRLTYADLPQVIAIERRAFPTPWSLSMFVLELSKPSGICLAGLVDGKVVGYLVCSRYDTVWHLMNVAIDPQRRRQGYAIALMDHLFDAADKPHEQYTLEVRQSNAAAIALYERFGFRAAGHRRGYYHDNREDALIMWRTVPAGRAATA